MKPEADTKSLFIFARNSAEMVSAQEQVITGMEDKLKEEKTRKKELEENLAIAKKNKWRTETLKRHVTHAQNRVDFYSKVIEALKAGYQIVPDMDVELFAVRTTKKKPRANAASGSASWGGPSVKPQAPDHAPTGMGKYVSPDRGKFDEQGWEETHKDGSKTEKMTRSWKEFSSPEFPFQLVKPQILAMTGEAMQKCIFDEMGVLPRTRHNTDPIVIGRISLKGQPSWNRKSVNFMVAWFIDLKDL